MSEGQLQRSPLPPTSLFSALPVSSPQHRAPGSSPCTLLTTFIFYTRSWSSFPAAHGKHWLLKLQELHLEAAYMQATRVSRRWGAWHQPAPRSVSGRLLPCCRAGWSSANKAVQSSPIFISARKVKEVNPSKFQPFSGHTVLKSPGQDWGEIQAGKGSEVLILILGQAGGTVTTWTLPFLIRFWHCFIF